MPGIRATFSALTVAVCAVGIGACGGGDEKGPIPTESGEQLLAQLDQIDSAVQAGDCDQAQATAVAFATSVNELPPEVDGELRKGLVEASANLEALSEDPEQCTPDTGATGETGIAPTTSSATTTTETTTTDTTTEEPPGNGRGPPEDTPGNGNPGGGSGGSDDSSGGIGSDG